MTATQTVPSDGSAVVEGLPKSFVQSMRTLFDIMDDRHIGYVKYADIEQRWHEDTAQGLPQGVLANLRKVTPPDGYLSFDRFCAGLKMCLVKNRSQDDYPSSLIRSSKLTPSNSLEIIGPLLASSPQNSPQHKARPLSAPLLDQDSPQPLSSTGNLISKEVLNTRNMVNGVLPSNRNLVNGVPSPKNLVSRIISPKKSIPKYEDNIYHAKYLSSSSSIPLKIHQPANPSSNIFNNNNNKVYVTKSDIRMGVGGIKVLGKWGSSPPRNSIGPPKPPRVSETDIYHQTQMPRKMNAKTEPPGVSNSLERVSKIQKKWVTQRDESSGTSTRKQSRGGSLERLLETGTSKTPKEAVYSPPMNRTGMKSAIQSWFKEKSKSDLHKEDKNNNYHLKAIKKQPPFKQSRIGLTRNYNTVVVDSTYRGIGDGVDSHRNGGTKQFGSISPSRTGGVGIMPLPLPPPPRAGMTVMSLPYPLINHGRNSLSTSNHYHINKINQVENGIYGKVMETATAIPINYNGNGQITRIDNGGQIGTSVGGATTHGLYVAPQPPQVAVNKKTSKKKEPRRHTLQNGVDQNVMKRLRQLEAERDTLYQGLEVVERATTWFRQQLQGLRERINYLPFGPIKEPSLERQQEKLHFQLARIHEINAHLRALMEASDKGLPTHMNLAIRGSAAARESLADKERAVEGLKHQNKLLTEEVGGKSERITSLEREKAALFRELFEARARLGQSTADSTFM